MSGITWLEQYGASCTIYDGGQPDGFTVDGQAQPTRWVREDTGQQLALETGQWPIESDYFNGVVDDRYRRLCAGSGAVSISGTTNVSLRSKNRQESGQAAL